MANINIKRAPEFNLQNVRTATPQSAAPVFEKLTNTFLNMANERVAEESYNRGLQSQMDAGTSPVAEESGLFGMQTTSSKAFNKGARLALLSNKQSELDTTLTEIETKYQYNPTEMRKKLDEYKGKFLADVPATVRPDLSLHYAKASNNALQRSSLLAVGLEQDRQKASIVERATDLSNTVGALSLNYGANEATINEKLNDFFSLVDQASTATDDGPPVIDPVTAFKLKNSAKETIAINAIKGNYDRLGTIQEKQAFIEKLKNGELISGVTSNSSSPEQLAERISAVESGGNAYAKNPNSSATGAGQFLKATWLSLMKSNEPELVRGMSDDEILKLRNDKALSLKMIGVYADDNRGYLAAKGLATDDGSLYLAHFAGPEGAAKVLSSDGKESVESILGSEVVKANSFLKGMNADDLKEWANGKVGNAPVVEPSTMNIMGVISGGDVAALSSGFQSKLETEMNKLHAQTVAENKRNQKEWKDDFTKTLEVYQKTGAGEEDVIAGLSTGIKLGSPDVQDLGEKANAARMANRIASTPGMTATGLQASHDEIQRRVQSGEIDRYQGMLTAEALQAKADDLRKAEDGGSLPELRASQGMAPEVLPHDFSKPESASQARLSRQAVTDDPKQLLSDQDASRASEIWKEGGSQEREKVVGYMGQLAGNDPRAVFTLAKKVAKSDPAFGQVVGMAASSNTKEREVAASSMRGLNFMKVNEATIQDVPNLRRYFTEKLSEIIPDRSGNSISGMVDVAIGRYVDNKVRTGDYKDDDNKFSREEADKALHDIIGVKDTYSIRPTGGDRQKIIPYKYGVSASEMELRINATNDEALKNMNGGMFPRDITGLEINSRQLRRSKFVPVGRDGEEYIYVAQYKDKATGEYRNLLSGKVSNGVPVPFIYRFSQAPDKIQLGDSEGALFRGDIK